MNYAIQEYAQKHFKNEQEVITYELPTVLDLDCEPWELHNILAHLHVSQTAWSDANFNVIGFKNYDEDGNSYHVGLLEVNAKGRNREDFLQLAQIWEEAEEEWESTFNED